MSDPKKCAHPTCTCVVNGDQKYCSQICEDSTSTTTLSCDCPHASCGGHV